MARLRLMNLRYGIAASALVLGATGAMAQDADEDADDEARTTDRIVVTGSNIAGASDSGAIAVTTISEEELDTLGQPSTGELFENLPQVGAFEINDAADGPNDARGDVATVNLRGLGSGSTLILLNGRRIAAHGAFQDVSTQGSGNVPRTVTNVNAFPSAAISRVEVLRDGASALYGSDAVAGVVNTILSTDFDDQRLTLRYSGIEGTEEREASIDFATGLSFNDDDTRVVLVGSYFNREGLFYTELDEQFSNVDKRAFLGDSPYATANTDFRNTSTRSPFGQFRVGVLTEEGAWDPIDVGALTASDGDFHVQPCDFAGTREELGTFDPLVGCVGLDDGNLNTTLRFDFNSFQPVDSFGEGQEITLDAQSAQGRQAISDADRYNAYLLAEHDFANGLQAFGEFLFYHSETESQRAAQPIDEGLAFVVVPRQNYWNPVGAVTSPNRVGGIDAPDEGLDVRIDRYRPTEMGPRIFGVESTTFRALAGLRGERAGWDWEAAAFYSENNTEDTSRNRISKTAFQELLNLDTPDAINVFGGPNSITQSQLDQIRISVTNEGSTTLAGADFRVSRNDLFALPAGDVGAAFGAEWRNEGYEEDRDPRLDGTVQFTLGTGDVSDVSDVVGVSPTIDSDANRNVFAAFGEVLVPVLRSDHPTFVNELNLQFAARAEYFDDIEESVVKPKVAVSYFPVEWFNVRAAYSQGFRAPNLVQLNRGDISRLNQGIVDSARCDVTDGEFDCGDTFKPVVRLSNPDLEPEETETYVIGLTVNEPFDVPGVERFSFFVDYWNLDQTDIIGIVDPELILDLDAASINAGGSGSLLVERAGLTAEDVTAFDAYNMANPDATLVPAGQVLRITNPYVNLDGQQTDGIDFGLSAAFESSTLGDFTFRGEATKLLSFDVIPGAAAAGVLADDDPFFATGSVEDVQGGTTAVDRVEVNGNPEWRALASVTWRKNNWGAGASMRYVNGFFDTSADPDLDDDGEPDFFRVDRQTRVNTYVDYRFRPTFGVGDSLRLRVGVNNLFDQPPPLADESTGLFRSVHSIKGREYYVQLRGTF